MEDLTDQRLSQAIINAHNKYKETGDEKHKKNVQILAAEFKRRQVAKQGGQQPQGNYLDRINAAQGQIDRTGMAAATAKGVGRGVTGTLGMAGDLGQATQAIPEPQEDQGLLKQSFLGMMRNNPISRALQQAPTTQDIRGTIDKGVDALGGDPTKSIFEGGEDTMMGRIGEFVGAGGVFGGPGLARTAMNQGTRALATGARKLLMSNAAAGAGSYVGGEIAGTPGEILGAFAPGGINMGIQGATKAALRGAGKKAQAEMQANIREVLHHGGYLNLAGTSPKAAASKIEHALESAPGSGSMHMNAAIKNQEGLQQTLEKMLRAEKRTWSDEGLGVLLGGALSKRLAFLKGHYRQAYDRVEKVFGDRKHYKIDVEDMVKDIDKLVKSKGDKYWNKLFKELINEDPTTGVLLKGLHQELKFASGKTVQQPVRGMPWESVNNLRKAVGRKINNHTIMLGNEDLGELKKLYSILAEKSVEGAREIGGDKLASLIRHANGRWTKAHRETKYIIGPVLRKELMPEKIYETVIGTNLKNISVLRRAMKHLTPMQREAVVKGFVGKLAYMDDTTGAVLEELWSPGRLVRNWQKIRNSRKDVLFQGKEMKKLRKEIDRLVKVMDRQNKGARAFANPSGTAGTGINAATLYSAMGALGGLVSFGMIGVAPAAGMQMLGMIGAGVGGIKLATKLTTSPEFIRWLAQGTQLPPGRMAAHISKLAAIAQRSNDPVLVQAIDAYNSALIELAKEKEGLNDSEQIPTAMGQ